MARPDVCYVPLIVRHAYNAPNDFGGALQGGPNISDGHCDPPPFDVRAPRGWAMVRSNSL